jgi:hypothetical protein
MYEIWCTKYVQNLNNIYSIQFFKLQIWFKFGKIWIICSENLWLSCRSPRRHNWAQHLPRVQGRQNYLSKSLYQLFSPAAILNSSSITQWYSGVNSQHTQASCRYPSQTRLSRSRPTGSSVILARFRHPATEKRTNVSIWYIRNYTKRFHYYILGRS